jgi:hypothetical protein
MKTNQLRIVSKYLFPLSYAAASVCHANGAG